MVFRYITDKVLLILPLMKPLDQVEYVFLYIAKCTESTRQRICEYISLNATAHCNFNLFVSKIDCEYQTAKEVNRSLC